MHWKHWDGTALVPLHWNMVHHGPVWGCYVGLLQGSGRGCKTRMPLRRKKMGVQAMFKGRAVKLGVQDKTFTVAHFCGLSGDRQKTGGARRSKEAPAMHPEALRRPYSASSRFSQGTGSPLEGNVCHSAIFRTCRGSQGDPGLLVAGYRGDTTLECLSGQEKWA